MHFFFPIQAACYTIFLHVHTNSEIHCYLFSFIQCSVSSIDKYLHLILIVLGLMEFKRFYLEICMCIADVSSCSILLSFLASVFKVMESILRRVYYIFIFTSCILLYYNIEALGLSMQQQSK
jgi:hypothetical protein